MIDALRYEAVRLRTLGSTYWTIGVGLALCALIAFGFGMDARGTDLPPELSSLLLTGGGEGLRCYTGIGGGGGDGWRRKGAELSRWW
jgi:hypothetical protein